MYIYCGHGAGEQYLPAHSARHLRGCAAALLMGCSSGRLEAAGCYDASGPVLAYLMAGVACHPSLYMAPSHMQKLCMWLGQQLSPWGLGEEVICACRVPKALQIK